MDDFGEAQFMLSVHRNLSLLVYRSQQEDGYRLFKKNRTKRLADGTISMQYVCRYCQVHGRRKATVTVHVIDGSHRIKSNPDLGHNEGCQLIEENAIEAMKLKREMLKRAEEGESPRECYRHGLADIPNRFDTLETQEAVERNMPAFTSVRASLYRARRRHDAPNDNIRQLPGVSDVALRKRTDLQNQRGQDYQNMVDQLIRRFLLALTVHASGLEVVLGNEEIMRMLPELGLEDSFISSLSTLRQIASQKLEELGRSLSFTDGTDNDA